MLESLLILVTVILLLIALFISVVPFIPGPMLVWIILVVFGYATDFTRFPLVSVGIVSVLMIFGSTSDMWLRMFGMQSRGGSCWGVLGSFFGGTIGSFLIPIPILGTLTGAILGALLVELMRAREMQMAFQAGRSVLEMYLVNVVVEMGISLAMFAVFLISLWATA